MGDNKNWGANVPAILLPEPDIDTQLSLDEINERLDLFLAKATKILGDNSLDAEGFTQAVDSLLVDVSNLVGAKLSLEGDRDKLIALIEKLKVQHSGEVNGYDADIAERRAELSVINMKRGGYRAALFGVYTTAVLIGVGAVYSIWNAFTTSDAEYAEQVQKNSIRGEQFKRIFSQLGITVDRNILLGDSEIRLFREDNSTAFGDLELYDDSDSYNYVGEYKGYDLQLRFPYYNPQTPTIKVGNSETTLFNPDVNELIAFIEAKIILLEEQRIVAEQEAAARDAAKEEERLARELAQQKREVSEAEAKRLEEQERQTLIDRRKEAIRQVIANLSGNDQVTITAPFEMNVKGLDGDIPFVMTPNLGTGELSDEDYLDEDSLFKITSNKVEFTIGDNNYGFQIEMNIEVNPPHNINITKIDSFGEKGPIDVANKNDFNGQDVSVFLKYLEDYIGEKL